MSTTDIATDSDRLARFTALHLLPDADTTALGRWAAIAEEVGDPYRGVLMTRCGRLLAETGWDEAEGAWYARTADVAATLGRDAALAVDRLLTAPGAPSPACDLAVARLERWTGHAVVHATYTQVCHDVPGAPPEPRDPVLGPAVTAQAPDADALLMLAISEGWRWQQVVVDVWAGRVVASAHLTRGQLNLTVTVGQRDASGGVYRGAVASRKGRAVARGLEACTAVVASDPLVAASWSATVHTPARLAVVRDLVERAWGHAAPTPQIPRVTRVPGDRRERVVRQWAWTVPPLARERRVRWVTLTTWRPVVSSTAGAAHTTPLGHQISLGRQHTNLTVTYNTGAVKNVSDRQLACELGVASR